MAWQPPDPPDAQAQAQGWTPPDPPDEGPGLGERAMDAAMTVAFPHKHIASAVKRQIERGGEAAMALPGQAAEFASSVLTVPAKTLASDVGLPVGEITPEEDAAYRSAMIDLLMTLGGGKVGQAIGRRAGDIAKYIGRGGQRAGAAERFIAREAPHVAQMTTPRAKVGDLLGPILSGGAVAGITDWMNPARPLGGGEFGDAIVAGGAGAATTFGTARQTLQELLLTNPRWQQAMMSPSRGEAGQLIGALIGYLLSRGAGSVGDLMGGEEPPLQEPHRVVSEMPPGFYRPPPGRY